MGDNVGRRCWVSGGICEMWGERGGCRVWGGVLGGGVKWRRKCNRSSEADTKVCRVI